MEGQGYSVVGHHSEAGALGSRQIGGYGRAGVTQAVGACSGHVDLAGGRGWGDGVQHHAALVQGALVGDWNVTSEALEGQVGLEYLWAENSGLKAGVDRQGSADCSLPQGWQVLALPPFPAPGAVGQCWGAKASAHPDSDREESKGDGCFGAAAA